MRLFWTAMVSIAFSASVAAEPPDQARLAATAYLDGLAEQFLSLRAQDMAAIRDRAGAEKRQTETRAKILSLIGGLPDQNNALHAQIFSSHKEASFHVENITFESLPGFLVTANVYVPEGKGPFPAIIISPGHSPSGKVSDYSTAVAFVRAGFVVLAYDILGEGERLQHFDPKNNKSLLERPTAEHSLAAYQSLLVGKPVVRLFINDAMRGIDYLESRQDVDHARIGAFGCSGGGAITAYVAALDARVKAAASACFVTSMHELLKGIGPQEGEQSTPGFTAAGFDLVDWVELAAPKPYAIVSTTEDMFPYAGAHEAYNEAKKFWSLWDSEDGLVWITGLGHHGNLKPIIPEIVGFFVRNLKSDVARKPAFADSALHPEDLVVTKTGQLSTSLNSETVQSLVKTEAVHLTPRNDAMQIQKAIKYITKATLEPGHSSAAVEILSKEDRSGYRYESLRFAVKGALGFDAILAIPTKPTKGSLLYLDGVSPSSTRLEELTKAGWVVLAPISAGGHGEEIKAAILGDYTLFALRAMLVGRTITGLRMDQAIIATDWLTHNQKSGRPLAIYGAGAEGLVALHMAALDKRFSKAYVADTLASYQFAAATPITKDLPEIALPNVLGSYDVPDLVQEIAPRKIVFISPRDPSGKVLTESEFDAILGNTNKPSCLTWLSHEPSKGITP